MVTCLHQTGPKGCTKTNVFWIKSKGQKILTILQFDPWQNSTPYEKLVGDLSVAYSRRINIQHRLVYQGLEAQKVVKVLRL